MKDKIVPIRPGEAYILSGLPGLTDDAEKKPGAFVSQEKMDIPPADGAPPFRSLREAFFRGDEDEKLRMIWNVAKMDTVNSVSKDVMHMMLKYLAELTLEEA